MVEGRIDTNGVDATGVEVGTTIGIDRMGDDATTALDEMN
jgi:hypothetical protein